MKIVCISVGKKHDVELVDAISVYEKRLKTVCDFSWQIVPGSDVDIESMAIERLLSKDDLVILLDERGLQFSSKDMANSLERAQNTSVKKVIIIIGGAYGVNASLRSKCNVVLSLSRLVFPHQIVRLLVVEQLYRAFSILSGSKYHHE